MFFFFGRDSRYVEANSLLDLKSIHVSCSSFYPDSLSQPKPWLTTFTIQALLPQNLLS